MGHGVRSALVTAIVHALVDHAAPRVMDPGKFLAKVNQRLTALVKPAEGLLFATAFYLVVDSGIGRIQYACAGHPAPLHLRCRRGTAGLMALPPGPGPALGIFRNAVYTSAETPLEDGDIILLYTDGLFEVTDLEGLEEYGRERLLGAARRNLHLPPSNLCDALIADVRAFAGSSELSDDVCLLSVEAVRVGTKQPAGTKPLRVTG
jgi:sigma-B regulation protein RsbU (phosphoserine phosphatase)